MEITAAAAWLNSTFADFDFAIFEDRKSVV